MALALRVRLDELVNVPAGSPDLAGVLLERVNLVLDGIGDVYEGVRVLGAPHQDIGNLVCLQAFLNVLVVVQKVTGIGEYGVKRDLP